MKLSELLLREVGDPRVHGVHVTSVEMGGDLSFARIHWRPTPGEASVEQAEAGLRAAAGHLRRELGRRLRLRSVPRLTPPRISEASS